MRIEYGVLFLIEALKYRIALNMLYGLKEKRKRQWFTVIVFIIYMCILYNLPIDYLDKRIILYFTIILNQYVVLGGTLKEKNIEIWISVLCLSCADEIYAGILSCMINSTPNLVVVSEHTTLISSVMTFFTCILLDKIRKDEPIMNQDSTVRLFIREKIEVLFVIFSLIVLFSIACLSYVKEYASNDSFVLCANVVCVLSFFSLLLLVVFWIYIKHSNERLMQHIAVEQKLKELQKKYYNTLLAKDEDTRKFRHDINNHLICLHALANKTQQPSIINYIEEVQQGLLKIQKGSYDTGNDIIDAFLNYEAQKRRNRVEIKIIGTCTNKVTISDVDMCIIFSNLLSNAFEELDRIEFENNQKPQKLFVSLSQNDNCFRCQIKNTKRDIERKRIKSLRSEKNDNVNHGFGLENVREAVQRNKGLFNVLIDKEWYVCSIIFKT